MRRLLQLVIAVLCVTAGAAGASSRTELLVVRPAGGHGPLVAYDARDGKRAFALPAGIASADGSRFFSLSHGRLRAYNARTGALARSSHVRGGWGLGAVSAHGRWVALERVLGNATGVEILAGASGRLHRTLRVPGRQAVDAVSEDGRRLYLIEDLAEGRYNVRLYDLAHGKLRAAPLREKGNDEVMAGTAWSAVGSPSGRWLLTLYLNTSKHEAFVHTLDLVNSYPVCIDLPGSKLTPLRSYSVTLSPDGAFAYAANPALGKVVTIDLERVQATRTVSFRAAPARGRPASAISADGWTLYFAAGSSLWAYDASTAKVRGPYPAGAPVSALRFARDGRHVYALRADGRLRVLDAASGRALR